MTNYNPPPDGSPSPEVQPVRQRVRVGLPSSRPMVVYTLMAIMISVFLLQQASQFLMNGVDIPGMLGMKVNNLIIDGQLWRLITPMFLHGSILHLGFNMYALYIFGPGLERNYGHGRFLALFMLSGFAGNVLSFLFTDSPSLGSSTAIFGLLGAEAVFLYQNRQVYGQVAQRALMNIALIAAINFMIGLSPGIDNWGHLGGLLGGVLFAWSAGPKLRVEGVYPNQKLVDERESGEVWRAGVGVGLLFAFLVAATMFFNIR